jgi:uncharacterized protein
MQGALRGEVEMSQVGAGESHRGADVSPKAKGVADEQTGATGSGGHDREGGSGHRLLNPTKAGASRIPCVAGPRGEPVPVPFVDEALVIDPESLKVWELRDGGPLPETDGVRVNAPCAHISKPRAVCLSVTRACNLACRYCYVHNRPEIRGGHLSVETAVKAIKLCDLKGTRISFFGGEPLLRFDVIREVVAEAERICEKPRFHVTTNGVLLDDEKACFFAEHGFSFIVSLDGPPDIHNYNRPLAKSNCVHIHSYGLTLEGLKALKRHGVAGRVTLRSTYTKDSIHLRERLAHLNDLCDWGYGGHVSVEAVSSSEASCIDPHVGQVIGFDLAGALRLRGAYREAFDWALERARSGRHARWHHLNHFAERILSRSPALSECGAAKGYISVAPEGELFACHREAGRPIGHADQGIYESQRTHWMENRLFARQSCPDCWCRHICGGGCRADSVVHVGDIAVPYGTSCTIAQVIIANVIRLLSRLTPHEQRFVRKVRAG